MFWDGLLSFYEMSFQETPKKVEEEFKTRFTNRNQVSYIQEQILSGLFTSDDITKDASPFKKVPPSFLPKIGQGVPLVISPDTI